MIQQFSRFIRSGPGLEKTLRLIQAVSQVAAVLSVGRVAVSWTKAKLQLALSEWCPGERSMVCVVVDAQWLASSTAVLPLLQLHPVVSARGRSPGPGGD